MLEYVTRKEKEPVMFAEELVQSLKNYQRICDFIRHHGMREFQQSAPQPSWWDK